MKKRLWIVSELFYPEENATAFILAKIANTLCSKYEVNVICGPSSYSNNKNSDNNHYFEINDQIKIRRVSDTKLDKDKLFSRMCRFLLLSYKLSISLWKNLEKDDVVFIVTNPAPLLLIISLIKKIKKSRLIILVHDVFPENTIPAKIIKDKTSLFYQFLKKIFDYSYQQANLLIVLGRDMKEIMVNKLGKKKDVEVCIIENWAEINKIDVLPENNIDKNKKIRIQYAGNLGRVQGLMSLLSIIKRVDNNEISFSFWGDGAIKCEMEQYVKDEKIENVYFGGRYPRSDQNKVLNDCDIAIITLAEGMYGLGVPSKSYNIMAAGKPILFIGDTNSEIALVIKENEIGFCFETNDVEGIYDFFKELDFNKKLLLETMGKKARKLAESEYSEEIILKKYLQVI